MKEKILIIDDEPLVLSAIERALQRINYTVRAVQDGKSFIEALSGETFDLIIMDLHIPDMPVENLVKKAMSANSNVKFLYISGSNHSKEKNFIQKPFRIDELRSMVREILDEPRRV